MEIKGDHPHVIRARIPAKLSCTKGLTFTTAIPVQCIFPLMKSMTCAQQGVQFKTRPSKLPHISIFACQQPAETHLRSDHIFNSPSFTNTYIGITQITDRIYAAVSIALLTSFVAHAKPSFAEVANDAVQNAADVVSDVAGTAASAASDVATEAARDDSMLSKGLFNLALGLLIYVTIGSIILSINKFIVNRNDKLERKWVKNRLEGKPFPSNYWLDQREDTSLPEDFPIKPKRNSEGTGNRQVRREMKKSRDKDAKKSATNRSIRTVKKSNTEKKKNKGS